MIKNRLNRIETAIFSDTEIEHICFARRYFYHLTDYSGKIAPLSKERAVEEVGRLHPTVPASLLTANLSGILASAENVFLKNLDNNAEKSAETFRDLVNDGRDVSEALAEIHNRFPDIFRRWAKAAFNTASGLSCTADSVLSLFVSNGDIPKDFLPEIKKHLYR